MEFKDDAIIFDELTESIYSKILKLYPVFVSKCNSILFTDIEKVDQYIKYISDLYYLSFSKDNFDICWNKAHELNDGVIMTKFAIECIDNYLIKTYGSIDKTEAKNEIRKFLLAKKRDYKRDVLNNKYSSSELYNDTSKEKALVWLGDNEKTILTEFAFFRFLVSKTQIIHCLKTLEGVICNLPSMNNTMKFPEELEFYLYSANKFEKNVPSVEVTKDNLLNFFYEFEKEPGHFTRIFVAQGIPPFSEDKIDESTGALVVQDEQTIKYMNTLKSLLPNSDDQEIDTLIYNLNNYDFNEKGYIDVNIDEDIVCKLLPEDLKEKNTGYSRKKKSVIRQQVIDSINKTSKTRVIEYFVDENGASDPSKSLETSFLITEAEWLDVKHGRARIYLSKRAREAWTNDKNLIVLKDDYERIANRSAKQILFFLQGERIKSRNDGYQTFISVNQFKKYFSSNASDKNYLNMLEEGFLELRLKEILVSNFVKTSSGYNITFIPLSDFELENYNLNK